MPGKLYVAALVAPAGPHCFFIDVQHGRAVRRLYAPSHEKAMETLALELYALADAAAAAARGLEWQPKKGEPSE